MKPLQDRHGAGEAPRFAEFVALMAVMISLVALSIDAMLPAFPDIARDLDVVIVNEIQLIISVLFIGLALGQLFYGPLSDWAGRKPIIYLGFALFILGCFLSLLSSSFTVMLLGRFLQGLGAAAPRTVAVALVRDRFKGSAMARVMSLIMTVFIVVPILAPALGQGILLFAGWRSIFGVLLGLALISVFWLGIRQPETLPPEKRLPLSFAKLGSVLKVVFQTRISMVYTLIAGFVMGAVYGYINISQQIFQVHFDLGIQFPLFFGMNAASIGAASLVNGSLVMRLGMHRLANAALAMFMVLSCVFVLVTWQTDGHVPFVLFMTLCMLSFFAIGILFGNLNAIAMEPLGHVAGTGASVVGSLSTLVAVLCGYLIGHAYDGTLYAMSVGFLVLSTASFALAKTVRPRHHVHPQ